MMLLKEKIVNKKSIIDEIVELENLHWAWTKAKAFFEKNEYWFDQLAITNFTANYENELKQIIEDIKSSTYTLKPIKPIFFPKGLDEKGHPRNRQIFLISVRDQVVWLAVMNIVGKFYDKQMPFWSYGNRLYISMFPDGYTKTGKVKWGHGNYRNSTTNTYRNFQQSWPRFRKDIHLVSKIMSKQNPKLGVIDEEDIDNNDALDVIHKIRYKESSYWGTKKNNELYWASIDLTKFFPRANIEAIKKNFIDFGNEINTKYFDFVNLQKLYADLLDFKVDYTGIQADKAEYESIELDITSESFLGIPTALFSAGFLSNIAMLKVDKVCNAILEIKREVAHFRFVDDHTFLSTDADALLNWIEEYEKILHENFINKNNEPCMEINHNKTVPSECAIYIAKKNMRLDKLKIDYSKYKDTNLSDMKKATIFEMTLDPYYPSPLMNHTLEKMSMINNTPFDLLDSDEGSRVINDIEHLLITEFPDDEIRTDTRMAFASSRLAQYMSRREQDFTSIYLVKSKLLKHRAMQNYDVKIEKKLLNNLREIKEKLENEIANDRSRSFDLLIYTIRSHPDKLSLWKNTILYCEKNGFSEITVDADHYRGELDELWNLIQELYVKERFNKFSYIYVTAYFYDQLVNSIIRTFIALSSNPSYREINRKCSYLNAIMSYSFLEKLLEIQDDTYYFKKSLKLFKITISTIMYLKVKLPDDVQKNLKIDDKLLNKLDIVDWENYPSVGSDKFDIHLDMVVWNLIEKFVKTPVDISPIIQVYCRVSNVNNNIAYSIVSLYPQFVNEKIISKILGLNKTSYFPFSWWYEIFTSEHKEVSSLALKVYNGFEKIENRNAIDCYEYLNILKDQTTVLSLIGENNNAESQELFSLEIISLLLDNWTESIALFSMNGGIAARGESFPYNYIIQYVEGSEAVLEKIVIPKIIDERYFPNFINFRERNDPERQFIFGIGILLFQLITKTKVLPHYMYLPSAQLLNTGKFQSELEKHPVSSLTAEIINSCLSKRGRETQKLIANEENKPKDAKDEFEIKTVLQLKKYVNNAIDQIKAGKYIFDDSPRYLIPFSLQKLKADVVMHKEDR